MKTTFETSAFGTEKSRVACDFFLKAAFAFLQVFLKKPGGRTWFFDGEFVAESW
jgi:hypothetical protein